MINLFKPAFFLLLALNFINSCTNSHSNRMLIPSKECIELNNEGVDSLSNYRPWDGKKKLNTTINLFKQAIKCDSAYLTAYLNLAIAYDKQGSYSEEMITYNKMLLLTNNDPFVLRSKGILFEKTNHNDSANQAYYLAKAEYKKRLAKDPSNINNIRGMILLKALTDGKDEAIKELYKQIQLHPQLASQLSTEHVFYEYFDRHAYIYGMPTEVPLNK
jgi:tetratricopeptide (TPR) repeat protein